MLDARPADEPAPFPDGFAEILLVSGLADAPKRLGVHLADLVLQLLEEIEIHRLRVGHAIIFERRQGFRPEQLPRQVHNVLLVESSHFFLSLESSRHPRGSRRPSYFDHLAIRAREKLISGPTRFPNVDGVSLAYYIDICQDSR